MKIRLERHKYRGSFANYDNTPIFESPLAKCSEEMYVTNFPEISTFVILPSGTSKTITVDQYYVRTEREGLEFHCPVCHRCQGGVRGCLICTSCQILSVFWILSARRLIDKPFHEIALEFKNMVNERIQLMWYEVGFELLKIYADKNVNVLYPLYGNEDEKKPLKKNFSLYMGTVGEILETYLGDPDMLEKILEKIKKLSMDISTSTTLISYNYCCCSMCFY